MKNLNQFVAALFLMPFFILTACGQSKESNLNKRIESQNNSKKVVVLELFTSQGCSSCPPADKVLESYVLQNNPAIIPLSFHVDYWNYLGWKDPFSKATFSERQRNYDNYFPNNSVYTPQIIINGTYEMVGSNVTFIEDKVNHELKLSSTYGLEITSAILSKNKVIIKWKTENSDKNQIINFALVKKKEFTQIKRGENVGLKQTNYNIVFDFKSQKNDTPNNNDVFFDFNQDWNKQDFMIVGYTQQIKTGVIETGAKIEIE